MLRLLTFYGATLALGVVGCSSQDFPTSASGAPISERSARPYTAVDLGSLAGPSGFSSASDINDAGQIVGQSQTGFNSPQSHAVLWTKEGIRDLGVLAGNFSVAAAINPAGVVVGSSQAPYPGHPGWSTTHAFLWKDGVMRDLGTLGGPESKAFGINPRGQVVGISNLSSIQTDPYVFLWENGRMTYLGFQAFLGGGAGINPAGRVVSEGKLWDKGAVINLGTLGGCCTDAYAINAAGQVVGRSYLPGFEIYHAFLWDKGVMRDLGALGETSQASDINAKGQVVGVSGNRAFIWENGVMTELISLDRRFDSWATGINSAGQIVGYSNTERGARATLWTRK